MSLRLDPRVFEQTSLGGGAPEIAGGLADRVEIREERAVSGSFVLLGDLAEVLERGERQIDVRVDQLLRGLQPLRNPGRTEIPGKPGP